jgi:hypothetical protein
LTAVLCVHFYLEFKHIYGYTSDIRFIIYFNLVFAPVQDDSDIMEDDTLSDQDTPAEVKINTATELEVVCISSCCQRGTYYHKTKLLT